MLEQTTQQLAPQQDSAHQPNAEPIELTAAREPKASNPPTQFHHPLSADANENTNQKPFHIGIWCDYGNTLTPHDGIGVFVYNLARGLLQLPESVKLTFVVHDGDQGLVKDFTLDFPGRVNVIPEASGTPTLSTKIRTMLGKYPALSERLHAWLSAASDAQTRRKQAFALWLEQTLRSAGRWTMQPSRWRSVKILACLFAAPLVILLATALFAIGQLILAIVRSLVFPLGIVDRALCWLGPNLNSQSARSMALARESGCDIWVIPYAGFDQKLDLPSVVFVHDLVMFHYPEMFDPVIVRRTKQLFADRAREATIVACMSEFIRRTDLLGVLDLPVEKTAMIRPAVPADLIDQRPTTSASADANQSLNRLGISQPFILYPSAFRGYKNHGLLIRALPELRKLPGLADLTIVFTGHRTSLPADLAAIARELRVSELVKAVGRVDRATLADLYQTAFATIVPSLYEQGSFPVIEAILLGCPVACSEIESLREQCALLGHSMPYFDPNQVESLIASVRQLATDRATVLARQQAHKEQLLTRSWDDVAREWLAVFRHASLLHAQTSSA